MPLGRCRKTRRDEIKWDTPASGLCHDVTPLGVTIDTIMKNTANLIDANEEVDLEINVERTKYILLYRHQNVGQNWDIKIANRCSENVSQFKYLRTTVINQNLIQEEMKRRRKSRGD
jgi:hypothetical protein